MSDIIFPNKVAASLTAYWWPRIVAEIGDMYIKVAKVNGSLTWHSHDNEDELFFVLQGRLIIELEDRVVELSAGEMFIVPKGVRHNPLAHEDCHILLVERKSTLHTGNVTTEKTRLLSEQFGST